MFGKSGDKREEVEVLLFGRESLESLDVEFWIRGWRGGRCIYCWSFSGARP
jgi:hypothetical protein